MSTRTRAGNRKEKMGAAPIIRTPKPVKSIGRDAARCYCQSCGRKRNVCTCGSDAR